MQLAQIAIFKFAIYLEKPETQLFYYAIKTRPMVGVKFARKWCLLGVLQICGFEVMASKAIEYDCACGITKSSLLISATKRQ